MSLRMRAGAAPAAANPWFSLWPFWLFLLALLGVLGWISLHWAHIMSQSVEWQRQLHRQLAQLIQQVQLDPQRAGGPLLLFSLTYGILHAIGPGHGKVVITTYLATHPSRLKLSLGMTLAASLLQGAMAIALVTLVLVALRLSSGVLHLGELWLERGGYLLMVLAGLLLCRRAARRLWRAARPRASSRERDRAFFASQTVNYRPADAEKRGVAALRPRVAGNTLAGAAGMTVGPAGSAGHSHHAGCGHSHLPDDGDLRAAEGWRTRLAVVMAMGLRPCSGAVLVLLFAKVLGVYLWGVLSALVMAAGTSLTLLSVSLLVFFGRRYAERLTHRHAGGAARTAAWASLSLAGSLVLIVVGVVLFAGAQSALTSGVRPFSH
ncbi:nickel/cobalt transporter [Acerihabitans sp.]|uniref:nickel/cobalt transporter n=1 Tax=Acerihabitans sp. TaxID=2811394 RepID=UPI002ED7F072